jgi:prepilin peptidase CpaA
MEVLIMEALTAATLLIFPAFMAYAAASDLVSMRISNRVSLGLIASFLAFAVICQMPIPVLGWHAAAGFGMLVIGFGLFAMGWIGGGDAKLAAATALWLGPELLLNYVVLAGFAGGMLTLAILNLRSVELPLFTARWTWLHRLHHKDNGVPYGIALAFAGLVAFPESPIWRLALLG